MGLVGILLKSPRRGNVLLLLSLVLPLALLLLLLLLERRSWGG